MIRRGDLVLDIDGHFGLVKDVYNTGLLLVRLGNGLVVEIWASDLPELGQPAANFAEEMRPDWADPLSPRYRPPTPDEEE